MSRRVWFWLVVWAVIVGIIAGAIYPYPIHLGK